MRLRVVFLLLSSGCGRVAFDGMYGDALVVSTTEDRLEGPATAASLDDLDPSLTDLSLREALTIAGNTVGATRIVFDSRVFRPGGSTTILLGSPLPALAGTGMDIDARAAGITLDGSFAPLLEIGGTNNAIRGLGFAGTGTRVHVNARSAQVVDCRFTGGGIAIDAEGSDLELDRNAIEGGSAAGIRITNVTTGSASSNSIHGVASDAIAVASSMDVSLHGNDIVIGNKTTTRGISLDTVSRASIIGNVIDPGAARLIDLFDSPDAIITGNILDRGDAGVVLEGASTNAYVFRNVVIMPNYEPMYIASTATGARVINNTYYLSGAIVTDAADTVEVNSLQADSGFASPETYDFHLVAGNAAIDKGMDVGQDMLDGNTKRFLGAAPDLGAVESW